MPNKSKSTPKKQSQSDRFIEAARKAGVDESGRTFARAIKKVAKSKPVKP